MSTVLNHFDGPEVQKAYSEQKNYFIKTNTTTSEEKYTVVYFSSNGIYFPNTVECFTETILHKNRFEWTNPKNQIPFATKSIFVRDIFKQWYLKGINSEINTLDQLIEWIRKESIDSKLICVGSSAGGYTASVVGSALNAEMVFCFSGQLSLLSIFRDGQDQLVNDLYEEWKHYYCLDHLFSTTQTKIFYFGSAFSEEDTEHLKIASQYPTIYPFIFNTSLHGIPFKLFLLKKLLAQKKKNMVELHSHLKGKILTSKDLGIHLYPYTVYHFHFLRDIAIKILKKMRSKIKSI